MTTALVTGSNRGLGLEFVRQYAEAGWTVHACCRKVSEALQLIAASGRITIHTLDVANHPQIEELAKKLHGETIDVLLNNAGVYVQGAFGRIDYRAWQHAFAVNTLGPLKMAEAFAEHVEWSERKIVACISSTACNPIPYASSKAALNRAVRQMAVDLKTRKVIAVAIHPGHVKTDMGGKGAPLGIGESVLGVRRVLHSLRLEDSGKFLNYDGNEAQ